jgi:hypothetical protein
MPRSFNSSNGALLKPTPLYFDCCRSSANMAGAGELLSKAVVSQLGIQAADIAYQNIQGRRAGRAVPIHPNGILHDYVSFYFAPRSPMLMTINSGNGPNCPYRQDDIVHLVSNVQDIAALGLPPSVPMIMRHLSPKSLASGRRTEITWLCQSET